MDLKINFIWLIIKQLIQIYMNVLNKTSKEFFEKCFAITLVAGLFMPYVDDVVPIEFMLNESIVLFGLFILTIPLFVTIPFLLILMFKDLLKNSLLKILKGLFLFVYIIVFGFYCYSLYDSFGSIFGGVFDFSISILISLILLVLSFKYSSSLVDQLHHILLAIMSFPITLFSMYALEWADNYNYGGYIINICFLSLYLMTIYTFYKIYTSKKSTKRIIK